MSQPQPSPPIKIIGETTSTLLIGTVILFVIVLAGTIYLAVMLKRNLVKCSNNESYKCPTYSCPIADKDCSFAPYRCIALDASSSTCSGANKVCMPYDITDGMSTKTSVKK
jgi:hypothetical protein